MDLDNIKPADVYVMVKWNFWLIGVLCALVVIQIIVKAVLDGRLMRAMKRTENLLTAVEAQGEMTDAQKARMVRLMDLIETGSKATAERAARAARAVAIGAAKAVQEIPDRTADKVVERIRKADSDQKREGGGSGVNLGGGQS